MQYKNSQTELTEIVRFLSLYRVLSLPQLEALFPHLVPDKLMLLLHRLEKSGRILLDKESELVKLPCGCESAESIIAAIWVLLDFFPAVTYHCASDFPAVLTFYTDTDAYDVIHIPEEKELLMNHALSARKEDAPRRLVIINDVKQISLLSFPGISAFCIVEPDGKVQYFRKQGVTDG